MKKRKKEKQKQKNYVEQHSSSPNSFLHVTCQTRLMNPENIARGLLELKCIIEKKWGVEAVSPRKRRMREEKEQKREMKGNMDESWALEMPDFQLDDPGCQGTHLHMEVQFMCWHVSVTNWCQLLCVCGANSSNVVWWTETERERGRKPQRGGGNAGKEEVPQAILESPFTGKKRERICVSGLYLFMCACTCQCVCICGSHHPYPVNFFDQTSFHFSVFPTTQSAGLQQGCWGGSDQRENMKRIKANVLYCWPLHSARPPPQFAWGWCSIITLFSFLCFWPTRFWEKWPESTTREARVRVTPIRMKTWK